MFDLEQSIFDCWYVTKDLQLLAKECERIEDAELADKISNTILGMQSVYDMRFEELYEQLEKANARLYSKN